MFFNPPNYTSYEVIIIIIIHVTSRCSTSNYSYCLTPDERESSVYEYVPGDCQNVGMCMSKYVSSLGISQDFSKYLESSHRVIVTKGERTSEYSRQLAIKASFLPR